jgi:hypothetical protein
MSTAQKHKYPEAIRGLRPLFMLSNATRKEGINLRPKEKGSGHALAGQRANNVLNLEAYSFCFLFFYTNSEPIPSPLGKAKAKAETTKLVQTDVQFRSFVGVWLLSCLLVLLSPAWYVRATRIILCHSAVVSFRVVMGGIINVRAREPFPVKHPHFSVRGASFPVPCCWPRPRAQQRTAVLGRTRPGGRILCAKEKEEKGNKLKRKEVKLGTPRLNYDV